MVWKFFSIDDKLLIFLIVILKIKLPKNLDGMVVF